MNLILTSRLWSLLFFQTPKSHIHTLFGNRDPGCSAEFEVVGKGRFQVTTPGNGGLIGGDVFAGVGAPFPDIAGHVENTKWAYARLVVIDGGGVFVIVIFTEDIDEIEEKPFI